MVQNPPSERLSQDEMDSTYALPYQRTYHPMYEGHIPAIDEVKFSLISNRGCLFLCPDVPLRTYHSSSLS